MSAGPKVLAAILARGGSKGVKRKNIRLICGRPLIAYTIETALAARHFFYRVIVSTDDPEIAEIARRHGAEVPFRRPAELAGDGVPTVPVLQHAVRFVEQQDRVRLDWIYLLQPTEPFRTVEDMQEGLRLAFAGGCDSVISVVQAFATHPVSMKRIENGRVAPLLRRRDRRHPKAGLSPSGLHAKWGGLPDAPRRPDGAELNLGEIDPPLCYAA